MPIYDCSPKGSSTEVTGVTSFNNRTGAVMPQAGDYNASDVGAVDISTTVNGKQLNQNITLSAEDVNADPEGSAQGVQTNLTNHINDKNNPHEVTTEQINAVPTSRTINGISLTSNVVLGADDVDAISITEKGSNNGVATLDSNGKIPVSQVPIATNNSLGSIIVGDGLNVDTNGNVSVNGEYLTESEGDTRYDVLGAASNVQTNLTNHINNHNNPHEVTIEQIGAASSGFGFGEKPVEIRAESADESYEAFCAKIDAYAATLPNVTAALVAAYPPAIYSLSGLSLAVIVKSSADYIVLRNLAWGEWRGYGWQMIRRKKSQQSPSSWLPFEWVDPPLNLGVEYRTVERYLGRPVYVKLFNYGALRGLSWTPVTIASNIDILFVDLGRSILFSTSDGYTGGNNYFPLLTTNYSTINPINFNIGVYVQNNQLVIESDSNVARNYSAYIYCRYTKITD